MGARYLNMKVCHTQDMANKDSMLHYIDCGSRYINSTDIIQSVMPDGLHPNHVGMDMLAQVRDDPATPLLMYPHSDAQPSWPVSASWSTWEALDLRLFRCSNACPMHDCDVTTHV
jgi:hypothetical protein